jgi:hypothetical protein
MSDFDLRKHVEYLMQLPQMPSDERAVMREIRGDYQHGDPKEWSLYYMPGGPISYPRGQPMRGLMGSGVKQTGSQLRAKERPVH